MHVEGCFWLPTAFNSLNISIHWEFWTEDWGTLTHWILKSQQDVPPSLVLLIRTFELFFFRIWFTLKTLGKRHRGSLIKSLQNRKQFSFARNTLLFLERRTTFFFFSAWFSKQPQRYAFGLFIYLPATDEHFKNNAELSILRHSVAAYLHHLHVLRQRFVSLWLRFLYFVGQ